MTRHTGKRISRNRALVLAAAVGGVGIIVAANASAGPLYWDTSDSVGLQAGDGTWSTSAGNWNASAAPGDGGRGNWVANSDACFKTNETSTVTVSGTVNINSIVFDGTGYTIDGTTLTLTGTGGNITANQNATINAPIGGSVGLTKLGTAALTLSGNNSYTGKTTVSAGVLRLASQYAVPGGIANAGGTSNLTLSSGVVELGYDDFKRSLGTLSTQVQWSTIASGGFSAYGADRTVNIGNANAQIAWEATNFVQAGYSLILGASTGTGKLIWDNPLDLKADSSSTYRKIQVGDGSAAIDALINRVISSSTYNSNAHLIKTGAGTLELNQANTYGGSTTVRAGTLLLSNNSALGTAGMAILADSSSGTSDNVALLTNAAVAIARPIEVNSNNSSGMSTIGGNSAHSSSFTGDITLNKAVTLVAGTGGTVEFKTGTWTTNNNAVTIGKSGYAGTVKLSRALSTSAAVNVDYGTLWVNGVTLGGAVTVASGATLKGTGTISKPVVINNGGTLAPGASPGTQNYGSGLTINGGGIFQWEHDAGNAVGTASTNYDVANVTGTTTIQDGALMHLKFAAATDFSNSFWDTSRTWSSIIISSSTRTGSFATGNISIYDGVDLLASNGVVSGQGTFSTGGTGNNLDLIWTPEITDIANVRLGGTPLSGTSRGTAYVQRPGSGKYINYTTSGHTAVGLTSLGGSYADGKVNPEVNVSESPTIVMLDLTDGTAAKTIANLQTELMNNAGGAYTVEIASDNSALWQDLASHYGTFDMLVKFTSGTVLSSQSFSWKFDGGFNDITVDRIAIIPEPATMAGVLGLGAMAMLRRRRNRKM